MYQQRQANLPMGLAPLEDDNDEVEVEVSEEKQKKMFEAAVNEVSVPVNEPVSVAWDGPDDPHNPQNFSVAKKWTITAVCCALTVNAWVPFFLAAGGLLRHFQQDICLFRSSYYKPAVD